MARRKAEQTEDNRPSIPVGDPPQFVGLHAEFLKDETPEIDLEGGRYSGKTWACSAKVANYCEKWPGMEWLICRYSNDDALTFLKPVFERVCRRMGHYPVWEAKTGSFTFTNGSIVYIGGLRSQDRLSKLSKTRGRDVGGLWADQSEEIPEDVGQELRFATRQPGYPHPLIFSPNPPPEDHWLADAFPEDNSIPGRKYYRLSLYDNPHCPEDKLAELERAYPPTHASYKRLILGLRGPAVVGQPIYQDAFDRELHVKPATYDPESPLLEAFDIGRHHPVWMVAQRNYFGGFEILGGLMGKRMFIEDFLPVVDKHRFDWFGQPKQSFTCCDPPPSTHELRLTNVQLLRDAGLKPVWKEHANSPDIREAVIQNIAALMRRRLGPRQALIINDDPKRWLMASSAIIKQSKFFVDGCEASYAWDDHFVSVGSKKVRQPAVNEWVDGAQRCLENLLLNFGRLPSREQLDKENAATPRRDYYTPQTRWS